MQIGQAGLDLIKDSEQYHRALKNGDCASYLCPAGVPTIGWGTTDGIRLGMVWTRDQAEAAFQKDVNGKFGTAVDRLVTVEINRNQRDALVSLAYNIGEGGLAHSGVLALTNARNFPAAARAFAPWNKARAGGTGPLVVMPGLVTRRAREAALYLTPVASEVADEQLEPDMPQAVEPPTVSTLTDLHAEAHDMLKSTSWSYWANHFSIRSMVAFAAAVLAFAREHAVEIAVLVVLGVVLFELVRNHQRTKAIAGGLV